MTTGHASLQAVLSRPPRATWLTAGAIVVVSIAARLHPELGELLEKQSDAIRAGELWRLFTVALVHAGPVHLLLNTFIFLQVGGIVERLSGALRMSAIFWIGTAAGTLASAAATPAPSVGASGGVFALLGALWAVSYRHRRELPPPVRSQLLRSTATTIGLNVLLGFSIPHIDWAAHLGGLAAGVLMGLALGMEPEVRAALRRPHGDEGATP
jgi:membrane associated rhomboid family serine protease